MNIEGTICRLRALEPDDLDTMYRWENDTNIWRVSGTTAPFSRHSLMRLIDEQRFDIYATRQQRLVIETTDTPQPAMAGAVDLFEFDPQNLRAGVGIMTAPEMRGRGYGPMRSRLWRDIAAKRSTSTSCGARYRPTTRPAYGSSQRPDMRSAAAAATGYLRPKAGATRYYYRKSCSRRYKICGRYTCRILFCIFLITS